MTVRLLQDGYPHADVHLARLLERAEGVANAASIEARARIETGTGATWTEVAGVYAMFDGPESPLTQTFGLGGFDDDGEPVAAAALSLQGEVAVLAGASTIPEHRRRGAQLALLDARLRFAVERGAAFAMMVALPGSPSQRNAERQGFRVAYSRTKWSLSHDGGGS